MQSTKNFETPYMKYDGPFDIEIISTLASFLRENINANENTRRKLYRVFIELVQNVALYSLERIKLKDGSDNGKGSVSIIEEQDKFYCTTVNKIQEDHAPILMKNCKEINNSSVEQLRVKKKKLRELYNIYDTGAHIGLIMIYIYSGNKLDFQIYNHEKSGELYFKITATINKNVI